jgi:hypothetical protein
MSKLVKEGQLICPLHDNIRQRSALLPSNFIIVDHKGLLVFQVKSNSWEFSIRPFSIIVTDKTVDLESEDSAAQKKK